MKNFLKNLFRKGKSQEPPDLPKNVNYTSVEEAERTRYYKTEVDVVDDGLFRTTVTSVNEMATSRQRELLSRLEVSWEGLSKDDATNRITWILRPVDYALGSTFTNLDILEKEHYRNLQVALAKSELVKKLPKYGPNSYAKDIYSEDYDRRLTKEERHAITDLAMEIVPYTIFKNLISNGVKRYKKQLETSSKQAVAANRDPRG